MPRLEKGDRGVSKYMAKKCQVDGIKFDSLKEARRYQELRLLERAGKIADLRLQVPFFLLPAQRDENGNVVERAVKYIADFVYTGEDGKTVVEDTKGIKTPAYIIKRKLMRGDYDEYDKRLNLIPFKGGVGPVTTAVLMSHVLM